MSLFKEVGLSWGGEEYIVPPEKVMGLIEVVEDVITLEELGGSSGGLKRSAIAKAYANALRYAGCKNVTQQDIYGHLFNPETAMDIQPLVTSLLMMMIPPEHLQDKKSVDGEGGKKPQPKARKKGRG